MLQKIIDVHSHAFPEKVERQAVDFLGKYYNFNMEISATLNDLLKSIDEANIDKVVLHSTATSAAQVESINDWISAVNDERIIGFGSIHPDYIDIEKELNRMEGLGLIGIKLHPEFQKFYVNEKRMFDIYDMIQDRFIILFHAGDEKYNFSNPKYIAEVLDNFPKLKVIAAHLGGYRRWDEAEEYLVGKNLYLDTSSTLFVLENDRVVNIIRKHGVERILFGTDFPITSHKDELQRFNELKLSEDEKSKILYTNACKLFNLNE